MKKVSFVFVMALLAAAFCCLSLSSPAGAAMTGPQVALTIHRPQAQQVYAPADAASAHPVRS